MLASELKEKFLSFFDKKEALSWSLEFLTKELNFPLEKIVVSVFAGDKEAPPDKESALIWRTLGISKRKIYSLGREENWWGPVGETGPCGPCSEMYIETSKPPCSKECRPGCSCGKYLEVWNDVFMEYRRTKEGKFLLSEPVEKLPSAESGYTFKPMKIREI